VPAKHATGAPFEVHGYQTGTSLDVDARGLIGGLNARGWFELIGSGTQGFFVQPGFSGGPVWDVSRQACIGIIKAVATDPSIRVAFLVPTESLVRYLPGYGLSNQNSRSLTFTRRRYDLFVAAASREPAFRDMMVRHLGELVSLVADPTERYWIYEALGDIGGELASTLILCALDDEADHFARRGVENAVRSLSLRTISGRRL
jgi:hypothetical protein